MVKTEDLFLYPIIKNSLKLMKISTVKRIPSKENKTSVHRDDKRSIKNELFV